MTNNIRFGVVLQGVDDPPTFTRLARRIEELGFDDLWVTDSSLHARHVYSYLTLAATVTSRIRLGTSVTNPLTRHPAIGALAISTVDEISGGRAIYGIGAGDRPIEALGYRPAKRQTIREAVDVTRKLLAGDTVTFSGEDFSLDDGHMRVPTRADVPIYISATGPKTLRLAGEIADGVIMLCGLFAEGIQYSLKCVREGQAARDGRPLDIVAFSYGDIREDGAEAIESARPIVAWFCQTAPVYCSLAGMPDELVETVRQAYIGGEFQEAQGAARLIPDEMVRKLAFAGRPADGVAKIQMLIDQGVTSISFFPLGDNREAAIEAFGGEIVPRFR